MSFAKFSVNHSLFGNLISFMVIVAGIIVLSGINREVFPNVDFEVVNVMTVYPGGTPLDVEKLITVPIEKELKEVDGIKDIKSTSSFGSSFIIIKIDPDASDKKKVVDDIKNAVDKVKNLPSEIEDAPKVEEITSKQYPIIEVSLSGKMTEQHLREYADTLEDEIENIKGVAKANKSGYRDREIKVVVDPELLKECYVSVDEIEKALLARNISLPAGEMTGDKVVYSVRTTGEFETSEEVEDVIIRANDSGNWLKIKDVAKVYDDFKKEDVICKTLGTRSINLVILKKESGDAISIVEKIKKCCNEFLKQIDDPLEISYINDYSFRAKNRLNILISNGWSGFILVVLSMMMFFEKRVAFITVLGIPVALFTTFIVMNIMGITINMISMFGLIVVLGMLVGDGIVFAENIYRYMEEGVPPRDAAVKGAEDVLSSVLASVLTTIAAFSPLLFMTGIIGKFIRDIPIVVIVALLASLGEALIVLPCHMAEWVKIKLGPDGKPVGFSKELPWFKKLVSFYTKVVTNAIKRRYMVILGMIGLLFLCGFLAVNVLKFVLFPSVGIDYFFIRAEAPIGTSLDATNELIKPVEDIVATLSSEEMESYVTSVGSIAEDRNDPFSGHGDNLVQLTVYLTQEQKRKRLAGEIIDSLRKKMKDIKGFNELKFDVPHSGPPVGKAVEAEIRGEDYVILDKIAVEFMDYLKTIDGTRDVTWNHKQGKQEIRVKIDNNKATMSGLSVSQIAKTIRAVFEGNVATKIKPVKAEEETDVTVMYPEDTKRDITVFDKILVSNVNGKLIPLTKVANIEIIGGETNIFHLDGKRVVTASCNVDLDKTTSLKVNNLLIKKFNDIPKRYMGYSVSYGGEQKESLESLISLLKSFIYAVMAVFLILVYFMKSIVRPIIVLITIPFGLIGVVIAFLLHNMPFSFMAILGVVGLNGIVVNDAIVFVDFIHSLRVSGMNRHDSIIKAGQIRIRPVILTSVTTVGGLLTVAYGIGGKDPFLVPMALVICWGISCATVLTLVLIPCIYSIADDIYLKISKNKSSRILH